MLFCIYAIKRSLFHCMYVCMYDLSFAYCPVSITPYNGMLHLILLKLKFNDMTNYTN